MKKSTKIVSGVLALVTATGFVGCINKGESAVALTVWVSEADKAFALEVADAFKKANPDKEYRITIDIQGENDVATRVLNDVENAADVYSFVNDQTPKLINGDALTRIAGDRLSRVQSANTDESISSVTATINGESAVYGMPYTDNTFFLYYDKSRLTETDVQSLDAILEKCTDGKSFAFPFSDGWYSTAFYFGKGLGYQVVYDDDLGEKQITCEFGGETGTAVTEAMWNYVKDARVKADANDSKITAGFSDGSIIAGVSGIWNKSSIEKSLGENFACAKLPTYTIHRGKASEEQVQLVSFAGYKAMGVNNYSKYKTDALDFAEFYTNRENQIKHFEVRGFVPTDEQARLDQRVQSDVAAQAITRQLAHSRTQVDVPSTLWIPMEGLGMAMITGAKNNSFDVASQLKACVLAIEKKEG